MPRKAKDEEIIIKEKKIRTAVDTKKDIQKSTKTDTKKDTKKNSKTNLKEKDSKKVAKTTKKATSLSSASTTANSNSVKKVTSTKENTEKVKKASSKITSKKSTTPKRSSSKVATVINEYYDLPASYPETVVKILAQTPTILFVYWDVSEKDKQKLKKQFGEDIFQNTTPYLIIKNETKNYQYEVEVNDYANSWYLHIPDSDCKYEVILIRKAKGNFNFNPNNSENNNNNNNNSNNNCDSNNAYKSNNNSDFNNIYYSVINNCITITSSNDLQTPNDHILFEKLGRNIFFQNVKNKEVQSKDISSFAYMHNIGNIYHIYDLYKEMYKDELNGDELGTSLSSSHMSF